MKIGWKCILQTEANQELSPTENCRSLMMEKLSSTWTVKMVRIGSVYSNSFICFLRYGNTP